MRIKQTVPSGSQSAGLFSACFFVNSSAFLINFFLSFVYSSAKSPRRGCSGSGSCMSATRAWITKRMFKKSFTTRAEKNDNPGHEKFNYSKMGSLNNRKGNLFKTYNFPLLLSDILRKVGNACVKNLILFAIL